MNRELYKLQGDKKSRSGNKRLEKSLKKSPTGALRATDDRVQGDNNFHAASKVVGGDPAVNDIVLSNEFLVIKDNIHHIARHIAQERATRAIRLKYGIFSKSFTVLLSCAYYSECTGNFPTWYAIQALSAPYVPYDNNTEAYQLIHKLIKLGYMERIKKGDGFKRSKSLYSITLAGTVVIKDYFVLYNACLEVFIRDYM